MRISIVISYCVCGLSAMSLGLNVSCPKQPGGVYRVLCTYCPLALGGTARVGSLSPGFPPERSGPVLPEVAENLL